MTDPINIQNAASCYRKGVGIVLFNKDGRVFAARRNDTKEPAWQMPQGGIDEGEEPRIAAFRELEEETGVTSATIVAQTSDWLSYDLPADIASRIWNGKYKGQQQLWFLMRFEGEESEICIDTDIPEFSEWSWKKPDEIIRSIVEFKRPLYEAVFKDFSSYLFKK